MTRKHFEETRPLILTPTLTRPDAGPDPEDLPKFQEAMMHAQLQHKESTALTRHAEPPPSMTIPVAYASYRPNLPYPALAYHTVPYHTEAYCEISLDTSLTFNRT